MMLRLRHERFVAEYLKDLSGARAYIRAGYASKGAHQHSARLLRRPEVRAAIEARQRQLADQFDVTQKRIVAEFAKLAFSNLDDFLDTQPDGTVRVDLSKADRTRRAALAHVAIDEFEGRPGSGERARRTRIKLASKQHALDSLARHLGMFVDRSEVTLVDNLAEDLAAARKRAWG